MRTGCIYKKFSKAAQQLHDYLRVRPVPVVVRKKKIYLVDHHHLVRALYDALLKTRGKKVLEEALFPATTPEARGLPGFRGTAS